MNRRQAITLAAAAPSMVFAAGGNIRFGGPIFLKSEDPAELAKEHRRHGYSAAYCPAADVKDTTRVRAIEEAFRAEDVVIAEVGAWVNMLDPDAEKRQKNITYVTERLALADAVGARCCVDIAGSYNPEVWYGPHPKNLSQEFFDSTVENVRKVIDAVKPSRTSFSLEIMGWCLPDGPDSYLKLMSAIDRKRFGVHLDICNGINSPEKYYNNAAFSRECFRKLGPYILSCHAKDLSWVPEMNVHFIEVVPGRGEVDYRPILEEMAKLSGDPPLMMEHLKTAEEYEEGARHIRKIAQERGVRFA